MTALSGDGAISKRHVFYIPGFDPRGPRHYHTLYRENAARQAAVNGWALDIGPRRKLGDFVHRWAVRGAGVETTYDFLAWDDIVRANWRGGVKARLRDLLGFYGSRVIVDLVPPVARQSPRRLLTGFYPLLSLLLLVALCVLAFVLIAAAGNWAAMSILLAAAAAAILWAAGVMLAERCAVFWLLKIFSFCARWGRGEIPALNARAGLFADHIASVLNKTDAQEVMIVGHSIGAIISVSSCAQLARQLDRPLTLVTLERVAKDENILWIDYSAPADGACFPLMKLTDEGGPVALSARFHRLFAPEKYRWMRYRWYKMHFLYLMASDYAGAYDFFLMTAGPRSLRMRLTEQGEI